MARGIVLCLICLPTMLSCASTPETEGTGGTCVPASDRAGREFGCFILASESLGTLGDEPVFWHISRFPSRNAAEAMREPGGSVVESFDQVWLFTISAEGTWPAAGERVAEIGPLPVSREAAYTAEYREAAFRPGMQSRVHRHSGPEAWYTLTGEMCLETPDGSLVGRAGGPPVIVPQGPPMQLTATGDEVRRGLVLVLHDSTQPASTIAPDWQPQGLCGISG